MTTKKHDPGTSDEGQLTASTTPYLPKQPAQEPYQPPPRPTPVMGPAIVDTGYLAQKLVYRDLASRIEVTEADKDAQVIEAASKARR